MAPSKALLSVYSTIMIVMVISVSQFAILSLREANPFYRQSFSFSFYNTSVLNLETTEETLVNPKMLLDAVYSTLAEKPSVEIFNAITPILNEARVKPIPEPVKEIVKETVSVPKKEEVKITPPKTSEKPKQTKSKAVYQRPLDDGVGVFTSRFGKRTLNGQTRLHAGIDIAAPKGSSIYAAKGGEITRAGWASGYGLLIEIKHTDGTFTKYAHCSKLLMKVGDKVDQGTEIAKVGNTGRSTGSHLHFEIIKNGKPINPYSYVKW